MLTRDLFAVANLLDIIFVGDVGYVTGNEGLDFGGELDRNARIRKFKKEILSRVSMR